MRYPWNLPRSLPALIFLAIFALQSSPNALAQTQGGGSAATVFLNFYNATQAVIKNPAQGYVARRKFMRQNLCVRRDWYF
jgi:hypothetical protein